MVYLWLFNPSLMIERVKFNKERPVYDIYLFHASIEGSCGMNDAKLKIKVSISINDECPELYDDEHWIGVKT